MDLKTRYVSNIYKMTDFTKSSNNHFIGKYGKTLGELTWFSLPKAEDPLDIMKNEPITIKPIIEEKPKEKPPTFIPNEIMRNILSYLPPPIVQPKPYSILNHELVEWCANPYTGYFCIMKNLTKSGKFINYDKFKFTANRENCGYFTIATNCRSKLYKDKENRCYYIKNNGDRYNLDNKLTKIHRDWRTDPLVMETEEYRKLLNTEYYYHLINNEELPIKIEVDSEKDKEFMEARHKKWLDVDNSRRL